MAPNVSTRSASQRPEGSSGGTIRGGSRAGSVAPGGRRRSSADPPTPPPRELSVAEKLEAILAKNRELEAELLQQQQLNEALEQQRRMEDELARNRAQTGPRREPATVPQSYRRAPKTRELPVYHGRSIAEAQDFFYQAQLKWREDQDMTWVDDFAKITHAVSYFDGLPRNIWRRKERSLDVHEIAWEEFQAIMMDSIMDPGNRNISSTTAYENAKQSPHQSVHSFVTYLNVLEDDLGYDGDTKQARDALLAKLRKDIRRELVRTGVPESRDELVSKAVSIENTSDLFSDNPGRRQRVHSRSRSSSPRRNDNSRRGGYRGNNRGNHRYDGRPQGQRQEYERRVEVTTTEPNNTPVQGNRGNNDRNNAGRQQGNRDGNPRSGVQCYKCKRNGHYARDCTSAPAPRNPSDPITCYTCGGEGHISPECPRNQSGNGNAQQ